MVNRLLTEKIKELLTKYPIVTLTGPRQSGKSTLLKNTFTDYNYVSLEDPDVRLFATEDPRGFLKTYPDKTIIDEATKNGEKFGRRWLYTAMIKVVAPIMLFVLLLGSLGVY
jgi:predicted AAA+ superfamily ATPase